MSDQQSRVRKRQNEIPAVTFSVIELIIVVSWIAEREEKVTQYKNSFELLATTMFA